MILELILEMILAFLINGKLPKYNIKHIILQEKPISQDIIYFLYYLILHQYATQIDNKHSMLFCWKGKDLLIRFTIEEAIDVDGGNAKSERERIATVYIKIVVNHSLKALQHNNLYFKVL